MWWWRWRRWWWSPIPQFCEKLIICWLGTCKQHLCSSMGQETSSAKVLTVWDIWVYIWGLSRSSNGSGSGRRWHGPQEKERFRIHLRTVSWKGRNGSPQGILLLQLAMGLTQWGHPKTIQIRVMAVQQEASSPHFRSWIGRWGSLWHRSLISRRLHRSGILAAIFFSKGRRKIAPAGGLGMASRCGSVAGCLSRTACTGTQFEDKMFQEMIRSLRGHDHLSKLWRRRTGIIWQEAPCHQHHQRIILLRSHSCAARIMRQLHTLGWNYIWGKIPALWVNPRADSEIPPPHVALRALRSSLKMVERASQEAQRRRVHGLQFWKRNVNCCRWRKTSPTKGGGNNVPKWHKLQRWPIAFELLFKQSWR